MSKEISVLYSKDELSIFRRFVVGGEHTTAPVVNGQPVAGTTRTVLDFAESDLRVWVYAEKAVSIEVAEELAQLAWRMGEFTDGKKPPNP